SASAPRCRRAVGRGWRTGVVWAAWSAGFARATESWGRCRRGPSRPPPSNMAVRADEISVARGRSRAAALRGWLDRESVIGPLFVAPAMVLLLLLVAYPFVMALYFAMSDSFI